MAIPVGKGWMDGQSSVCSEGHTAPSTAAWVLSERCYRHKRSGNEHELLGWSGGLK